MKNKKFLKDLSGSAIQIGVTQTASLLIFYLISKYISKEEFGFYNWATAICSTAIVILSLGMDLVYVRRVAAGITKEETISIHLFHTLLVNLLLIGTTSLILMFFPHLFTFKALFLLILINQSVINISNSIKLCLNGLEKYDYMAKVAIITSIVRVLSIVLLLLFHLFTMKMIMILFIANYLLEFGVAYFYAGKALLHYIRPKAYLEVYKSLIKESFPQLGTVLFDSAVARVDWILMGIIATSVKTAEYTFAYKMFEVTKLPNFIIAPILLTRFSKLFNNGNKLLESEKSNIDNLFKVEAFISILIPIVTIVIWTDFFDLITENKYGEVNQLTYTILGCCIPLVYSTNFLWTLAFTQGQLKMIFVITIITSVVNTGLNVFLIKNYGAEGAAISFLISTILQVILYYKFTRQQEYHFKLKILIQNLLLGVLIVIMTYFIPLPFYLRGLIAFVLYILLARVSNQISIKILKSTII